MVGLLSGRKAYSPELPGHYQLDFVDHYPLIWHNFSEKGYTTALVEEQPGIFSYKAKGFKRQPVDIYLRPFGLLLNNQTGLNSTKFCKGNQPEIEFFLNAIKKIAKNENLHPFFLTSFLWRISHDFPSTIQIADEIFVEFLNDFLESGVFENTIFFFYSDHGNRFAKIRQTLIGRLEERMPFMGIYLPPKFRRDFPKAFENLKINSNRLTAAYDLYETLLDILFENFGEKKEKNFKNFGEKRKNFQNRGQSLFQKIPERRNCGNLEIPLHFCLCQQEETIDSGSDLIKKGTEKILEEISNSLKGKEKICAKLKIKEILNAQKFKTNQRVLYNNRWHYNTYIQDRNVTDVLEFFRITFKSEPGNGIFEALVQFNLNKNQFSVKLDGISRINAYGNDGNCMSMIDRNLEKYCFCETQ